MDNIFFDVIKFKPITWAGFKKRYSSSIRISSELNKIKPLSVDLMIADKHMNLYGVWYDNGNWRNGENKIINIGDNYTIVRIPAFRIEKDNNFLIVDGMHRATQLKPMFILMDVVSIKNSDKVYINDMIFW